MQNLVKSNLLQLKCKIIATFCMQHSACTILHATFCMQQSSCNILHVTFFIQHSLCNILHATFCMQHNLYNSALRCITRMDEKRKILFLLAIYWWPVWNAGAAIIPGIPLRANRSLDNNIH